MASLPHKWWSARRGDLLHILRESCPVAVYDGETINDILFDLLSIDSLAKLFYPLAINQHPEILDRAHTLGAGFSCVSASEVRRVHKILRRCRGPQVLFVPGAGYGGDWDDPLNVDVLPVLHQRISLNPITDFLRGKKVLAYADVFSHGGKEEDSFAWIKTLKDRLKGLDASLTGFYVTGGDNAQDLERLFQGFPECNVLCLGRGRGIELNPETGCPDVPETEEKLEEIKTAHPGLELWVELDASAMNGTAALLTRVEATRRVDEGLLVRLDMRGKGAAISEMFLGRSRFESLSGEAAPWIPWEGVRISGYEHGNPVCMIPGDFPVNRGDVLLLTPIWLEGNCRELFPDHYLRARRICQVPL